MAKSRYRDVGFGDFTATFAICCRFYQPDRKGVVIHREETILEVATKTDEADAAITFTTWPAICRTSRDVRFQQYRGLALTPRASMFAVTADGRWHNQF